AAAARPTDLPARAVRGRRPALLRAPRSRAPGRLGRAEGAMGSEALTARRRRDAAADGLEEPDDRRAEAARRARQPLPSVARRSRRARALRRPGSTVDSLDVAAHRPAVPTGRARAARPGRYSRWRLASRRQLDAAAQAPPQGRRIR